jgi:hypothetical protein
MALASAQSVDAPRASAAPIIKSRIDAGPWTTATAIYPSKGQSVTLRVDQVSGATIRWYQIVPDTSQIYKNANHPWEANPYKWLGLAKIKYSRTELTEFRGKWEVQPFRGTQSTADRNKLVGAIEAVAKAVAGPPYNHTDVGSFWFQVEIEKAGGIQKSAGIEDSDKRGLSPKVFRVSIRDGEGYIGYLTSFLNVPGLFGSVPYQTHNYIGADCCDVLVAAYGKWKNKTIEKDYSVAMLVSQLRKSAEFDLKDGKPNKDFKWGKHIHPGNFIAVRFNEKNGYQHIGALFSDADKNGILSDGDLVLHAGPAPLHYSYLKEGKFDGHVVVLDHQSAKFGSR